MFNVNCTALTRKDSNCEYTTKSGLWVICNEFAHQSPKLDVTLWSVFPLVLKQIADNLKVYGCFLKTNNFMSSKVAKLTTGCSQRAAFEKFSQ